MANLQIKGVEDGLYEQIKDLAAKENRSVSQQMLFLAKEYLAKRKTIQGTKSPARVLLELAGSWDDPRPADDIIREIKAARKNTGRLKRGL